MRNSRRAARPSSRYCMGCAKPPLFQLLQQLPSSTTCQGLQRLAPAGRVHRDSSKQLAELRGRTGIETAVGALGQPGDFAEGFLGTCVRALLEKEYRDAQQSQLPGAAAQIVDVLLHAVADIDECAHTLL